MIGLEWIVVLLVASAAAAVLTYVLNPPPLFQLLGMMIVIGTLGYAIAASVALGSAG